MQATRSSETLVYNKPTQRHNPENGNLHSHRRENLQAYYLYYIARIISNGNTFLALKIKI
jgi:hypothetical protein